MPIPNVFEYPIKRPGFIQGVTWQGNPGDTQLILSLEYTNAADQPSQTYLYTVPNAKASLCLPTNATVSALDEDAIIAHIRMAGMISGTVPGSKEYQDAISSIGGTDSRYFQMPIGDVKVIDIKSVTERILELTIQKGSSPSRVVQADVQDLAKYSFAPSTQLLTVAGAIKKEFPTYIHDPVNSKFLTQIQMDTISEYVLTIEPWI